MLSRIALLLALTISAAFAYSEENVHQELDVKSGGNLVVDVAFGTIEVAGAANDKVSIEAHRKIETSDEAKEKQYLAEVPIVITNENNTVTVRARRTEKDSWSWNCSDSMNMDARYTIRVPKNFNLDLKSGGGGIMANEVTGTTKISTGGGKLKLAQLRGPVDAKTSGGSIRLNDCQGALNISTSGGEIKAGDRQRQSRCAHVRWLDCRAQFQWRHECENKRRPAHAGKRARQAERKNFRRFNHGGSGFAIAR